MRLHSHLWVASFIRQVDTNGASAMLTRRGEATAGAIYIKVSLLDRTAHLYSPAPSFMAMPANEANKISSGVDRIWHAEFGDIAQAEFDVDQFIRQQTKYDNDIWVIEVEDRAGRHFLGDQLVDLNLS